MGWVQENIAKGRQVRGMIVANEFNEKLKYAVKPVSMIALKKYDVSFKFANIS
jgi:endonuclease